MSMFGANAKAKKTQVDIENNSRNHFAQGTKVTGAIEAVGVIRIDGIVEGTINSKGKVVIGEEGKVVGDIICQDAEIEGSLTGNIEVRNLLYLKQTAFLEGDIRYHELKTDPGAIHNGKSTSSKQKEGVKAVSPSLNGKKYAKEAIAQ